MKFQLKKAETSVILIVFIQDSSLTTGAGLGSLDQTSSITGGYVKRDGTGVALAVDENVTTEGTYEAPSTAAQVRIGTPANMPTGFYELHFHNDLFTTADYVTIGLGGAANMAPLNMEIQLTSVDLNDATDAGLSSLAAVLVDTNSLNDTKVPQTLNLTASGNIGIDWANVENPTTALDLSQTDIQLCDTVTTNTDAITAADVLTTALTESYGSAAAARTLTQLLYEIKSLLTNFSITNTTLTSKKLDGSTTAKTYTLNSDTTPTALEETT